MAKKLVRGDYKSGRVKDPTARISSSHEKTVKKYVKEYMDKAVKKKEDRVKHKTEKNGVKSENRDTNTGISHGDLKDEEVDWDDDMLDLKKELAASEEASPADSISDLKRKREEEDGMSSPKKTRTSMEESQLAPPPPPPPPAEDRPADLTPMDDAFTLTFPEVEDAATTTNKSALQLNGHTSPMQLATPPTNGSGTQKTHNTNDDQSHP